MVLGIPIFKHIIYLSTSYAFKLHKHENKKMVFKLEVVLTTVVRELGNCSRELVRDYF